MNIELEKIIADVSWKLFKWFFGDENSYSTYTNIKTGEVKNVQNWKLIAHSNDEEQNDTPRIQIY